MIFTVARSFIRRSIVASGPRGLTVLELLLTMSIMGLLMTLVLPAVQAARESARRVTCVNHLREIGLAVHSHHSAVRQLPVGWHSDPARRSAYGWAVSLLPYLGQSNLYGTIHTKKHVRDPANDLARNTTLELMLCPSDITEPTFELFEEQKGISRSEKSSGSSRRSTSLVTLPTSNYVGVFGTMESDDSIPAPVGDGSFLEDRRVRFRDFRRGLSNTIIVGERTMAQVPSTWIGVDRLGEDATARLVGSTLDGINNPYADECDFSSRHPGGANFVWGDGHVSLVNEDIDLCLYHQSARLRDQGEEPVD